MKKSLLLLLFSCFSLFILANNGTKKNKINPRDTLGLKNVQARPDIPGTLLIDLGFNIFQNNLPDMELGNFGSKVLNFYYYFDYSIGNSHFSFNPAFGFGLDKYSFDKDVTLVNSGNNLIEVAQIVDILPISPTADIIKSKLAANYFDIPVEFRFNSKKNDHRRSFKVAIGGKIGVLLTSHTKIKYKEEGTTIKLQNKQDFNLNKFRYGAHARVGVGGFNVFFYYGISELFKNNKGPQNTSVTTMNLGISIAGF